MVVYGAVGGYWFPGVRVVFSYELDFDVSSEENAAVGVGCDLVVEGEFEVLVFFDCF